MGSRIVDRLGYGLLGLATLGGAGATAVALAGGHATHATTVHVPWGLWVALYIFFLGLSVGSFLFSTLVYVFRVKSLEPAGPLALVQALLCLVLGGILVILDLGRPERVWRVVFSMNPSSVMAWMGIFYNIYVAIIFASLYLVFRPHFVRRAAAGELGAAWYRRMALGRTALDSVALERDRFFLKILGIVGIPVAIFVRGGVGAIFAVAKARPAWFSGLFPIIFLVSALAAGTALSTLLVAVFSRLPGERKRELVRMLARLSVGILSVDLLLLASEILVTLYGGVPHESSGWRLVMFGPYWWVFWFVQLGLGALLPIGIVLWRKPSGTEVRWLGTAGALVVLGILGAYLNLVIPPQIEPVFAGLPEAYLHERFARGYFPSAVEWLVGLGVVSIGIWAFLGAKRVLPLAEAERGEVGA